MCVYIYIYMCVCIYIYMCVYIYIYTWNFTPVDDLPTTGENSVRQFIYRPLYHIIHSYIYMNVLVTSRKRMAASSHYNISIKLNALARNLNRNSIRGQKSQLKSAEISIKVDRRQKSDPSTKISENIRRSDRNLIRRHIIREKSVARHHG